MGAHSHRALVRIAHPDPIRNSTDPRFEIGFWAKCSHRFLRVTVPVPVLRNLCGASLTVGFCHEASRVMSRGERLSDFQLVFL